MQAKGSRVRAVLGVFKGECTLLLIPFGLIIALSGCRAAISDDTAIKIVDLTASPNLGETSELTTPGNQTATSSSVPILLPSLSPSGEPILEPIHTASPNSTPDLTLSSLPVIPTIMQICPEGTLELPLGQIGLGSSSRLLLTRAEDHATLGSSGGLWVVSEVTPQPQLIPNTEPPPGWTYANFGPSPEGHWIGIYRYGDDFAQSAWITSLDGTDYWLLTEGDYSLTLPYWVTEQEMLGVGVPNAEQYEDLNWEDYMPLFTLDPFTLEMCELEPLPAAAIFDVYFSLEEKSYSIYHTGQGPFNDWVLFNYIDEAYTPVFNWLVDRDDLYYGNTSIILDPRFIENSIFHIYVGRDYGFDLSRNLTLDEIRVSQTYEEIMTTIEIPGEYDDVAIVGWIDENSVVVESKYRLNSQRHINHFYVFNYESMILTEYCLNDVRGPEIRVSPDSRFLALTYNIDQTPEKVVILDLETGYRTTLPGFSAIGWGVAEPEFP